MSHGSEGGLARAQNLTRKERVHIARRAANARWKKPKEIIRNKKLLEDFCRKYKLTALYAFGSVLTDDFDKKSDVDLLFKGDIGYFEMCDASDELEIIFGRKIDFIRYEAIANSDNPYRRNHIMSTAEKICELGDIA
jgi:hypothetical protein